MKNLMIAAVFAVGIAAGAEAAPTDAVTQADLQALIQRITQLEAQNKEQAAKIAELEGKARPVAKAEKAPEVETDADEQGTTVDESGKVYKTKQGFKYYLADAAKGIFEPLSENGLKITPYGYLVFEGVHNTHGTEVDIYTDYIKRKSDIGYRDHTTVFSMQDSILGLQFDTPEAYKGWKVTGRAEFDLAGDHANDYAFHWRHLYFDLQNEEKGLSVLFGQTWHLWKMVQPSEIDGAWMENTGYPYRRSPQIRVTKKWNWEDNGALELRAGLVKNGPGMGGDRDDNGTQDNSASAWALFEAAAIYTHKAVWQDAEDDNQGKTWLFGVGGQYGRDRSRRFLDEGEWGRNDDYNSEMVMFAGAVPFWRMTLTGQVFAGENLGGVQAGVGQRVAFADDFVGKGEEVTTVGGFLDLAYQISDDWSVAVGYGFDNPEIHRGRVGGTEGITHNDRAYADVFYKIMPNFKIGLEYARLSTKYIDEGTSHDDRIQFSAWYDF